MEILRAILRFDDGTSVVCDVVATATRKLLVPEWIDTPAMRATRPARTIELDDQLLRSEGPGPDGRCYFRLLPTIPKAVFDGREFPKEGPFAKVELEPAWPPNEDE